MIPAQDGPNESVNSFWTACAQCGSRSLANKVKTACPICSEPCMDAICPFEKISATWTTGLDKTDSKWRYRGLLPITCEANVVTLGEGWTPMSDAFKEGRQQVVNLYQSLTDVLALATGFPGPAYQLLFNYMAHHGATKEAVSGGEAFQALHAGAKLAGLPVEPATGVAFAGLFKLIRIGVIQPDEAVVVNGSGQSSRLKSTFWGHIRVEV